MAEYSTQISQTPQVSYVTADHLGSPRLKTDQDGDVTNRKDYTAFGEENSTEERVSGLGYSGGDETRKGYTGCEKDDESGLDFAQAWYYNSKNGRYTSVDPLTASASIKNPQTFNRYTYVLNSPYKFTDPLGLIPVTTAASGNSCSGCLGGSTGPISEYGNNVGVFAKLGWDRSCQREHHPIHWLLDTTRGTAAERADAKAELDCLIQPGLRRLNCARSFRRLFVRYQNEALGVYKAARKFLSTIS